MLVWYLMFIIFGSLALYILWNYITFNKAQLKLRETCNHQYIKDENYTHVLYSSDLSEKVLHSKFTCHKCGFVKYQEYRSDT